MRGGGDLRFTYNEKKENVKSGFSTDGRNLRPRAVNTRIAKGAPDLTILRPRADRRWKSCALSAPACFFALRHSY